MNEELNMIVRRVVLPAIAATSASKIARPFSSRVCINCRIYI